MKHKVVIDVDDEEQLVCIVTFAHFMQFTYEVNTERNQMATIDSKPIIKALLENNGHYDDDMQVNEIYTYVNSHGAKTYAIYYNKLVHGLQASAFVIAPVLLWDATNGFTPEGAVELANLKRELWIPEPIEE